MEPERHVKPKGVIEERRQYRRTRLGYDVSIQVGSWNASYTGVVLDIQPGGVFIGTLANHRVGDTVVLRFAASGAKEPIHAKGAVRWRREEGSSSGPSGVGVQFRDLPATARDEICRCLDDKDALFLA